MIKILRNKKIFPATIILLGFLLFASVTYSYTAYNASCSVAGCNLGPINEGDQPQYKIGPLALGKASDPVSGASLDVSGTINVSSLLSFGNITVNNPSDNSLGNYSASNMQIDNFYNSGAIKRPVCTDQNGKISICSSN
ncbi:MAG: hypothetical protein NTX85_00870 [Candidatus Nomurabacteria bacterium]|nr:hypothetical protein [Candidatus Nomurabacteria bacterium]